MPDRIDRGQTGPGAAEFTARLQEIAPGEYAPEVYTVNAVTAAVSKGAFFIAGSGRLTLAAAGNIRGRFLNPAGSGKKVLITRLAATSTATAWLDLRLDPTTGLPAVSRTPFNAVLGGAAGVATVQADTDVTTAVGGGTLLSAVLGLPANTRQAIDLPPLVLFPGQSLGLNMALMAAADATFSLYWIEE